MRDLSERVEDAAVAVLEWPFGIVDRYPRLIVPAALLFAVVVVPTLFVMVVAWSVLMTVGR